MRRWSEPLDGISTHLILVAASLMTIGIVMVASTSANLDHTLFDSGRGAGPVLRQVSFVAVGLVVMLICGRVGPQMFRWRSGSWAQPSVMFLLLTIVLLLCVWVPGLGVESHGRRRWLSLGPIGFQPSEVAKLAIVIFLAAVLSRKRSDSEHDKPGPARDAAALRGQLAPARARGRCARRPGGGHRDRSRRAAVQTARLDRADGRSEIDLS